MTPELTSLVQEVLQLAGELGLTRWERIVVILAAAVALVLVRRGGRRVVTALKNAKVEEQQVFDENGAQPPGTSTPSQPENDGHGSYGG